MSAPPATLPRSIAGALRAVLRQDAASVAGVGVDVEPIDAFVHEPYDPASRFYARTFTAAEISACLDAAAPEERFAARFAAKEACLKALRRRDLLPGDVEIVREESGAPSARLPGTAQDVRVHLSMGHCAGFGFAVAVALADPGVHA